jgi:hypothetical protein
LRGSVGWSEVQGDDVGLDERVGVSVDGFFAGDELEAAGDGDVVVPRIGCLTLSVPRIVSQGLVWGFGMLGSARLGRIAGWLCSPDQRHRKM